MQKTYISLGKRIEKSAGNPYGWKRADYIPDDETCILVLGGNGADDDKKANGYAKNIDALLRYYDLRDGVSIYSVMYRNDAEGEERFVPYLMQKVSREVLFEEHGRKYLEPKSPKQQEFIEKAQNMYGKFVLSKHNDEISNPSYVERLFEKALLYRISDLEGHRLPLKEAMQRIRKINIVAHCHGAYLFLKLEEMMQQKMKELGYLEKEREAVQKQLLCVAFAPYAPLGVSKSTMISFGSVKDDEIWHQNAFHRELQNLDKAGQFELSYFEKKQGEVFVASAVTEAQVGGVEHNFSNYVMPTRELSKEGEEMLLFSRNAVLNGVRSSKEGKLISSVQNLLCGENEQALDVFEKLKGRGKKTYAKLVTLARKFALAREK